MINKAEKDSTSLRIDQMACFDKPVALNSEREIVLIVDVRYYPQDLGWTSQCHGQNIRLQ